LISLLLAGNVLPTTEYIRKEVATEPPFLLPSSFQRTLESTLRQAEEKDGFQRSLE